MMADFGPLPANPSSVHWFGQKAKALLSLAREKTARFFNAKPQEIIFTSGGTESLNLLLRSLPAGHIITSSIEHSAIYETLNALPHLKTTYLSTGLWGAVTPEQVRDAIRPDTKAIILTLSNAETGVKIDIHAIADLALSKNIPLLLDAVSYIGKEPLPSHPGISAMALSAHKFHGPKGIGALYFHHLKLPALLTGGGQENKHRSGTENLAGILGLAEALSILLEEQTAITNHLQDLQAHFEKKLLSSLPDLAINGEGPRVCNTSNIAFLDLDGETLLIQLDQAGIAASHGSACSSGALEPSRVLTNMGIDKKRARASIRFSFSRQNTREEVDKAADLIISIVNKYRKISP